MTLKLLTPSILGGNKSMAGFDVRR
eukprot:COSAG05_NODE_19000_length_299_cov_1.015000_1_plen_24_part_10